MLLDGLMPDFDAVRIEHLVVAGELADVYAAAREADLLDAWRGSRTVRVLFSARALGERLVAFARRRAPVAPAQLDSLRLADLPAQGDWVLLGEAPPEEISFGVIGRFWAGETVWERIDAADFASFDRPGRARIGCSILLHPAGAGRTLVSYECRTQGTDRPSTEGFLRYWRLLSPFIGFVMRAQLRTIARACEMLAPMAIDRRPLADRIEVAAPGLAALAARAVGRLPEGLRRRALKSAFDRARDAFNRGDLDAVFALFDPAVEYGPPPPLHDGGHLHGRAAVDGFWSDIGARYDSTIENLSIEEAEPGRFVRRARLRHRPKAGGDPLSYVIVQTTDLARGRVVRQVNHLAPTE